MKERFKRNKVVTECLYVSNKNNKRLNKRVILSILMVVVIVAFIAYCALYVDYEDQSKETKPTEFYSEKRYSLDFSAHKVRPLAGESNAFGYGYIQFSNSTENPYICWSFTAIGLILYIDNLNIHGPLHGTSEEAITAPVYISLTTSYKNDRYESCYDVNSVDNNGSIVKKINKIYEDPSKFYILGSTPSNPNGALWSNLGGQWDPTKL